MARTRWMFGFQRRLVRRCEWLTLMPNCGFLPHTSQTDAMTDNPRWTRSGPGRPTGRTGPLASERAGTHPSRDGPRMRARRRRDLRRVVSTLPRRAARPPGRAQPAQRLPGARRRHRHEHGAHPRVGRATSSATAPTAMARRLPGDQPRLAHGRPRQLGRDPVADPAGPRRHVLRRSTRSSAADVAAGAARAPPTPPTRR